MKYFITSTTLIATFIIMWFLTYSTVETNTISSKNITSNYLFRGVIVLNDTINVCSDHCARYAFNKEKYVDITYKKEINIFNSVRHIDITFRQ